MHPGVQSAAGMRCKVIFNEQLCDPMHDMMLWAGSRGGY